MGLHRIDREVEHGGDLLQGLIEHVLEDHHAALHGRKLYEPRHRGFDRLPSHHHLHRIWALRIGDLVGRLDGLGRADRAAAQQVQRAVVGDPEQPGAQRRGLLQFVQGDEGPSEGVLHHILAIDHRAHQARAVAVKLRPQLARRAPEAPRGAPWAATMGLRSSRLSLEDRDPRIALQAEGDARGVLRILQHRDQVVTELARR